MRTRKPRILVIARGHLGDMVGALPALRDLRAGYPGAHISVVANEYARGVLEGCPFVDEVIYGFGYAPRTRWKATALRLKLIGRILGRYDIALSLRMAPRWSPLLSLVSGAGTRVGYRQPGLAGRLLNHDLGPEKFPEPNRLTNVKVVRSLGLRASPAPARLDWISPADRQKADSLLIERGLRLGERFAVFQIASHWGCYEWRSDKWATVADHLALKHRLKVLVVGTGDDFELRKFAELSELSPVPITLQGKTTLPMLFHIVARASLVVAADSAMTQIAMAQGTPAIIMFGIEPKVRNGPLPEEAGRMEEIQHWEGPGLAPTPNPHCRFGQSHCHSEHCCENSSLQQIAPAEVCERADRILERVAPTAEELATTPT